MPGPPSPHPYDPRLLLVAGPFSYPPTNPPLHYHPHCPRRVAPVLPAIIPAAPQPESPPAAYSPTDSPRGWRIAGGARVLHDVSIGGGGAWRPQLEGMLITKYASEPALVLGRQIAVNRTYIAYGLKLGTIRVLNTNTVLRSLLRGHSQRVTDMAFFAADVDLLASASIDGRICVWKITEERDNESLPQMNIKVLLAIQLIASRLSSHPQVCWHPHKQEILFVGIENCVIRIDIAKFGRGRSSEETCKCNVNNLVDGLRLVGKHGGDVTDLSVSQWMTTRLASASMDGMVVIWDDHSGIPLTVLRPHDGYPVSSVAFLISPSRPDHINLLTAGPLNREIKLWASSNEEGWLLPSESESWKCIQALELISSCDRTVEAAFFNHVSIVSQASIILVANAKKNALYAVHVEYGFNPFSTHMDYMKEFTVSMPILSLTGTCELQADRKNTIRFYCIQPFAVQQYVLELPLCLPSVASNHFSYIGGNNPGAGKELANSCGGVTMEQLAQRINDADFPYGIRRLEQILTGTIYSAASDSSEVAVSPVSSPSQIEAKTSALALVYQEVYPSAYITPSSPRPKLDLVTVGASSARRDSKNEMPAYNADTNKGKFVFSASRKDDHKVLHRLEKGKHRALQGENSPPPSPKMKSNAEGNHTHLATPSTSTDRDRIERSANGKNLRTGEKPFNAIEANQIMSGSTTSIKRKHVKQGGNSQNFMIKGKPFNTVELEQIVQCDVIDKSNLGNEGDRRVLVNMDATASVVSDRITTSNSLQQSSGVAPNQLCSVDSTNESGFARPCGDISNRQVCAMNDMLKKLMTMQQDFPRKMDEIVATTFSNEANEIERLLEQRLKNLLQENTDVLWAHIQEQNAKREKAERERVQQLSAFIINSLSKDMPTVLERFLKKEVFSVGAVVSQILTQSIEKSLTSVADLFQQLLVDKVADHSRLEVNLAAQVQAQFSITGEQLLTDALWGCMESSLEQSCESMLQQVDSAFRRGMPAHSTAVQQQAEAAYAPLAAALRDTINSSSSTAQCLTAELLDGQRQLLALLTAQNSGRTVHSHSSSSCLMPAAAQANDPTEELSKLISQRRFEEAFVMALQRGDVSIVSWLCSQVDLEALCRSTPPALSQGVLLSLLQQLSTDIAAATSRKAGWMTALAMAVDPTSPVIAAHFRPVFRQVYSLLAHHQSLPATPPSEAAETLLVMHVVNSLPGPTPVAPRPAARAERLGCVCCSHSHHPGRQTLFYSPA